MMNSSFLIQHSAFRRSKLLDLESNLLDWGHFILHSSRGNILHIVLAWILLFLLDRGYLYPRIVQTDFTD